VAQDSTGRGHTANVTGAVYTAAGTAAPVDGPAGRAMSFDGDGDVLSVSDAATAFDALQTTNAVTVGFWILGDPAAQPRNQTHFHGIDAFNGRQLLAHVTWGDSTVYWDTGGGTGPTQRISMFANEPDYEDSPGIPGADWDHWVFIKNGDEKQIYANNTLFHSASNQTAALGDVEQFFIGAIRGAGQESYLGLIDDFIVFDNALDAAGVDQLFRRGGRSFIPEPSAAAAALLAGGLGLLRRQRHRRGPRTIQHAPCPPPRPLNKPRA
jgi:hypothetical protein